MAACAPLVQSVPFSSGFSAFYTKHATAEGISVVASSHTSDEALRTARSIIIDMLRHRPDLRDWLVAEGYRVAIMAESETTTDLPEQAHWTKPARDDPRLTRCEVKHYDARIGALSDREYWDRRARGMAGPLTSGAEEDLLGKPTSRYFGESIFVHEFSHNILAAIRAVDPAHYARVEAAYANAQAQKLWFEEYTMTSIDEYWAEGTQFWFNSNKLAVMDGRRVLNHEDLAAYDPMLFAVLAEAYGDSHRLAADPFYRHPARVPPGPIPENTAEVC